MSFLSFLFGRGSPRQPAPGLEPQRMSRTTMAALNADRSGSARRGTRMAGLGEDNGASKPADAERAERRDLLYGIVRESMMRAGVLSASYKFKVMSTDARGRQFLVMFDLAPEAANLARFGEIEALLMRTAKDRHNLDVVATYWRANPLLARGTLEPSAGLSSRRAGLSSRAAPLEGAPAATPAAGGERATTRPASFDPAPRPSAFGAARSRFDPIDADEVLAFRNAMASAGPGPVADGRLRRSGPRERSSVDFQDTQVNEPHVRAPGLSATQFGTL